MTTLDHQVGSHPIPNPSKSLITKLNMGTGTVVGAIFAVVVYFWLRSGEDMSVPQNDNRVLLISMFAWSVGFLV